ncbi:hypothetical protein AYK25_08030 [Thermoplasmatales archaeon SM1-50]|nr:MAG: hypothetical protein AYK25_08030 [Thermoplasmatales archaeon SM1-50]
MEPSAPYETSINDYVSDQKKGQQKPSSMPLIAGIFLIIAGLLGLFTWSSAIALESSMIESVLPADAPITAEQLQSFLTTCGIIGCILSVFTLTGGIVAVKRKAWGLAVVGGILGLFTIGPFLFGSIISLVGLIFVIISRKDFQLQ